MPALTREEIEARIEPWYRWWAHVALLVGIWGGVVLGCALRLENVQWWHWGAFALALIAFNALEYFAHRWPFHHKTRIPIAYERHTLIHHAFFTWERNGLDRWQNLRYVLQPPFALVLIFGIFTPGTLALLRWAPEPNFAWLHLLAIAVYYAVYEGFHTAAHLPDGHWLGKNALVRFVTLHHRRHHDPKLMLHYNFNFAFPLFDWVFGTLWEEAPATTAPPVRTPR